MHLAVTRVLVLGACLFALMSVPMPAIAQPSNGGPDVLAREIPELRDTPELGQLAGQRVARIEVVVDGDRWKQPHPPLRRVRAGETLSFELARRALRELTDSGRYATARAEAEATAEGVVLRLIALPRRTIASIRLSGGALPIEDTLRAAEVSEESELTPPDLAAVASRIRDYYVRHGFTQASVEVETMDTDVPLRVLLLINVEPGEPQRVGRRTFVVHPDPEVRGMVSALATYGVEVGDRVDSDDFIAANQQLERELRVRGWHRATVSHTVRRLASGGGWLRVDVRAGPLMRLRFEGNRRFDAGDLAEALDLEETDDRSATALRERLRRFYLRRGLLDAEVEIKERGAPGAPIHDLLVRIREREPVRVVGREFTCLSGSRSPAEVGSEIDSFLSEELPGTTLYGSVDPAVIDSALGPTHVTGARVAPYRLRPWQTYVPEVYERALKHVQDLYRSEGYLSATVGPVQLVRRRCSPRSPPGRCIPLGGDRRPATQCRYDEVGMPLDEPPPDPTLTCEPDPSKGVACEPDVVLHVPVKLGPRTYLYDVQFEGNRAQTEQALQEAADLEVGGPASQVKLQEARRRVLDAYAEEGFAYAEVETQLEFSPDRTRARVRYLISESEQVRVAAILVRGARITKESLILGRVALEVGEPYRRSDIRATEERLATLGVFSNITVGLENPYVPAREKAVVITVVERIPQYTDVRVGFSTGEGIRLTFEYGHRNLFGEAIQLTLRSQLGYLPDFLILERDVRRKFPDTLVDRLERRNTASLQFPEIGLGPLFRLGVDGVDVRDNSRDFGLTRDAGILTLIFRPNLLFSAQIGGSIELNDVAIFGEDQKGALQDYVRNNPSRANAFRVPEGKTVALAQRLGTTWDRRDNPLGATRGTLVSASIEHVRAVPVGGAERADATEDVFAATTSEFLRISNQLGGYVRLSDDGLALAASFRWGLNYQLIRGSRTYPDRLFFLGGVDSIRGFLQDSLVPQDIADQLLDPDSGLTINEVVIRGGDVFINPRMELRIPLSGSVQTAVFVDTGNVWTDPDKVDPSKLRYAVGSGLRVATPVGPLVFDYGFNLERVLDELDPGRPRKRFWEDLGAFHFSIGLF